MINILDLYKKTQSSQVLLFKKKKKKIDFIIRIFGNLIKFESQPVILII